MVQERVQPRSIWRRSSSGASTGPASMGTAMAEKGRIRRVRRPMVMVLECIVDGLGVSNFWKNLEIVRLFWFGVLCV